MSAVVTVRIPDALNKILEKFCEIDERSKSWFIKKALQSYIEDREDYAIGMKALKEHEASGERTYTIEELAVEYGIALKSTKQDN